MLIGCAWIAGCEQPVKKYFDDANEVAAKIIEEKQMEVLGRVEPFTIETPEDTLRRRLLGVQKLPITGPPSLGTDAIDPIEHWPGQPRRATGIEPIVGEFDDSAPVVLTLEEALQVAARNSRDYQNRKESIFMTALRLDLRLDEYRNTYGGILDTLFTTNPERTGFDSGANFTINRQLEAGGALAGRLAIDLANLLSSGGESSVGVLLDASVSIPLLAGRGKHIEQEPLIQAERNLMYALWDFERFKRTFAVSVARDYLNVLTRQNRVDNSLNSYKSFIRSKRRSLAMAESGRENETQVGQARQSELRGRQTWINEQNTYEATLDRFKILIGLPTDAKIAMDRNELTKLADLAYERLGASLVDDFGDEEIVPDGAEVVIEPPSREGGGPFEMDEREAIELALSNRMDLRSASGEVYDAQREVVIMADALGMGLDLTGGVTTPGSERRSLGTARQSNGELRLDEATWSLGLDLDLPWERTAEQINFRNSYIAFERSTRDLQQLEDQIKQQVRADLRQLLLNRESYKIQVLARDLAERPVASTEMFMEAGRNTQIRDVLEAKDDLLDAENSVTSSLVDYRVAELELQRDMGVLVVNEKGLWREYDPNYTDENP
ncbi:MAG: TolC family protein [Planctomycetota bacterium]|jgi:outer membrane protein TolC